MIIIGCIQHTHVYNDMVCGVVLQSTVVMVGSKRLSAGCYLNSVASFLERFASWESEGQICCLYALLFLHPKALICTSERPAASPMVAAPIQKLWVLNWSALIPICASKECSFDLKRGWVK